MMLEFTFSDVRWFVWLPMWIKCYILQFIYYLGSKNIITTEIKVITPCGKFVFNDICSVPEYVINTDTGESYWILVEDIQVWWKILF